MVTWCLALLKQISENVADVNILKIAFGALFKKCPKEVWSGKNQPQTSFNFKGSISLDFFLK